MIDKKQIAPKSSNNDVDIIPDENTGVMIYGNIKIEDLDTKETIVNKRA